MEIQNSNTESKKVAEAYVNIAEKVLDPKETVDRETLATVVAYVVKKGPQCYNDKTRFGDKPWCEEKQWVLIGRYSGSRFKLEDGAEVRIINDDEVIATILNPDDIVSL